MCFLSGMLHLLKHAVRFGRDAADISGYASQKTHPLLLSCFRSFQRKSHVSLSLRRRLTTGISRLKRLLTLFRGATNSFKMKPKWKLPSKRLEQEFCSAIYCLCSKMSVCVWTAQRGQKCHSDSTQNICRLLWVVRETSDKKQQASLVTGTQAIPDKKPEHSAFI